MSISTFSMQRHLSVSLLCSAMMLLGTGLAFATDPGSPELKLLYSFTGGIDGGQPMGAMVRDSSGDLYGTTEVGGRFNAGVVFKLSPQGKEVVLHHFTGGTDGGFPLAALIRDAGGNLYGTTSGGGTACLLGGNGCGVVFRISSS